MAIPATSDKKIVIAWGGVEAIIGRIYQGYIGDLRSEKKELLAGQQPERKNNNALAG